MKNMRSKAIWEGTRTDAFASGTTELQASVRMNLTDDLNKGLFLSSTPNPKHLKIAVFFVKQYAIKRLDQLAFF